MSSIRIYIILGVNTLYRLFCCFKLFPVVGKGLMTVLNEPQLYGELATTFSEKGFTFSTNPLSGQDTLV